MISNRTLRAVSGLHCLGRPSGAWRQIDTVIIGGKVRKRRGRMTGVNLEKFRQLADESRQYLFAKAGYTLDIFSRG
jgi:hypothetical protein